jgi:hypothetical protein
MERDLVIDLDGQWRFRLDPEKRGEHYPEQLDFPWSFDARWMNLEHDLYFGGGRLLYRCLV